MYPSFCNYKLSYRIHFFNKQPFMLPINLFYNSNMSCIIITSSTITYNNYRTNFWYFSYMISCSFSMSIPIFCITIPKFFLFVFCYVRKFFYSNIPCTLSSIKSICNIWIVPSLINNIFTFI